MTVRTIVTFSFLIVMFGCVERLKPPVFRFANHELDSIAENYLTKEVEDSAICVIVLRRLGAAKTAVKFSQIHLQAQSMSCDNLHLYNGKHAFILLNGVESVAYGFDDCSHLTNLIDGVWDPKTVSVLVMDDSIMPYKVQDFIYVPNPTKETQKFED